MLVLLAYEYMYWQQESTSPPRFGPIRDHPTPCSSPPAPRPPRPPARRALPPLHTPPSAPTKMRCWLLCAMAATADAHGSMIMPASRNSVDADLPAWSHGKFPETGLIEPYTCHCNNGTDECSAGQSCFWFSQVRSGVRVLRTKPGLCRLICIDCFRAFRLGARLLTETAPGCRISTTAQASAPRGSTH
eukprot:SAG31_NODE_1582_length_7828_cov_9.088110_1_plen_189_part_00